MGSRNTDGTRILQTKNPNWVAHEGEVVAERKSTTDVLVERKADTAQRPSDGLED